MSDQDPQIKRFEAQRQFEHLARLAALAVLTTIWAGGIVHLWWAQGIYRTTAVCLIIGVIGAFAWGQSQEGRYQVQSWTGLSDRAYSNVYLLAISACIVGLLAVIAVG
jgi:hypothetical protein